MVQREGQTTRTAAWRCSSRRTRRQAGRSGGTMMGTSRQGSVEEHEEHEEEAWR
jgi:hypothetical protein